MAQETVGLAVADLTASFAAGLECYAGWRQRHRQRNNYHVRGTGTGPGTACAANSSLAFSKLKIEETFHNGADVLGDEFVTGDAACRNILLENLRYLQDCIEVLQRSIVVENHALPLAELIGVSEAVRVACLAALHQQYQRIVVGRLAPRAATPPSAFTVSILSDNDPDIERILSESEAEAAQTRGKCHLTEDPHSCQNSDDDDCRPPSPPLTPIRAPKRPEHHKTYPLLLSPSRNDGQAHVIQRQFHANPTHPTE
ncbi:hypothetical protein F4808DRAFT_257394 [Astrocystis sublimbata]|nr:hypothetical protein F4808DRAFT_257394 [Astrocystis sublimbata]